MRSPFFIDGAVWATFSYEHCSALSKKRNGKNFQSLGLVTDWQKQFCQMKKRQEERGVSEINYFQQQKYRKNVDFFG